MGEKRVLPYRVMKAHSLSNFHYLYITYYNNGRTLGTILAGLIVAASIILGLITKNIVIDTVVYSIAFGSFVYNYAVIRTLNRGQKEGYFSEGEKFEHFDSLKKSLAPMVILSRFFEIYTPFLLAVIMPNVLLKVLTGILFTAFVIFYKFTNNFVENKLISVIKKNSFYELVGIVLGVFLSMQTIVAINVYDNVVFLFLGIIIGLFKYAVNKNIRDFFVEEKKALNDKKSVIDIYNLGNLFLLPIKKLSKYTPEEGRAKDLKDLEEEKKREAEKEKRRMEACERSIAIHKALDEKDKKTQELIEKWEENGRREKERKKLEEKALRGEVKLSDEEVIRKKELQSKQREVKIVDNMNNDRASLRR